MRWKWCNLSFKKRERTCNWKGPRIWRNVRRSARSVEFALLIIGIIVPNTKIRYSDIMVIPWSSFQLDCFGKYSYNIRLSSHSRNDCMTVSWYVPLSCLWQKHNRVETYLLCLPWIQFLWELILVYLKDCKIYFLSHHPMYIRPIEDMMHRVVITGAGLKFLPPHEKQ